MSQMLDPVTQHHVRQAAEALSDEFAGVFSQETIERYLAESVDLLGSGKINVFVPVLADEQHLGLLLAIIPSACASALRRSRAKRCASTGTKTLILPPPSRSVDSAMYRSIVSCEKTPANSSTVPRRPVDVVLRDGIERLGHRSAPPCR